MVSELVSAAGVLIGGVSFAYGVHAWRREFIGQRRIDLVEAALANFLEAADAIRAIRSPFSSGNEGSSRARPEGEDPDLAQLRDRAHIAFERYQEREQVFTRLFTSRYRVMATFGKEARAPYDQVQEAISAILAAAQQLGSYYWPRLGRVSMTAEELKRHLQQMHRLEDDFWATGGESDRIEELVARAVKQMDELAAKEVASVENPWRKLRHQLAGIVARVSQLKSRR